MSELEKSKYKSSDVAGGQAERAVNPEHDIPLFAQGIDDFLAWYRNIGHRYEEGVIDITQNENDMVEKEASNDGEHEKMLKGFENAYSAATLAFPDSNLTLEEFIHQVRDSSLALKFDPTRGRLFTPPDLDLKQLSDYSPRGVVGLMSLLANKKSELINFFDKISWWNNQDDHEYIVDVHGRLFRKVFNDNVGQSGEVEQIYPKQI